jgi:uncharacterized UBP type Zn finger protein
MQAILHLRPLKTYIEETEHNSDTYRSMKDLYKYLIGETYLIEEASNYDQVTTFLEFSQMKNQARHGWGYVRQQDCCEYLYQLFEKINQEIWCVENLRQKYDSAVNMTKFNELYNLLINEQISCGNGIHDNKFFTNNSILQLGLPMRSVSLYSLIVNYFKQERTNVTCDECKSIRYSRKAIFQLQEIICIQLKRYYMNNTGTQIKNEIKIDIDFIIDSAIFGSKNLKTEYVLSAIVCHEGETPFGGHYIAYCEEEDGN